jgi:NAD(P)H-flavin reductase
VGRQALVTQLLAERLDHDPGATVYACGPPPMLEAVRALCADRGVSAQLALESGMACGFGACFGCVVPTKDGYIRLCLEGPVLPADRLESALFPGAGH